MKRLLILFLLLMLTESGWATVWNSDGTQANIQAIHNNASTVNGDTITLPAGTFSWTGSNLVFTKAITLQGQTTVAMTGSPPTSKTVNNQTIVVDNVANRGASVGFLQILIPSGTAALTSRITGITFQGGSSTNSSMKMIHYSGSNPNARFRFDHNHMTGVRMLQCLWVEGNGFGVADHNVWDGPSLGQQQQNQIRNGTGFGDLEFSQDANWGTEKAFFFEDNWIENAGGGVYGGMDSYQGARYVVRNNFLQDIEILDHGTELGRGRGGRTIEIYRNHYHQINATPYLDGIRCGVMIAWGNRFTGVKSLGWGLSTFRLIHSWSGTSDVFGGATGANAWDLNDATLYASGTVTASTNSGTQTITDNTKTWTPNQWVGYTASNASRNVTLLIESNTSNSLTGPVYSGPFMVVGDHYEIRKVLIPIDMSCRGRGDLLSGDTPTPRWLNQVREPCYAWDNIYTPDGSNIAGYTPSHNPQLVNGVDYFNNTVMPGYTFYTYPHPLVGAGSPSPTPTATPCLTPAAPSALIATATSTSAVSLAWTDNASNEVGFKIENSTSPTSGFVQIGTTGQNVTTFTASGLNAGTTYYFRTRAYLVCQGTDQNSGYSNTASATTLTPTPTPTATATPTGTPTATPTATPIACSGRKAIPRGAYELMSGKLDHTLADQPALDRPSIDGIRLKSAMDIVETSPYVYDFSFIDSAVAQVAAKGKKCGISINFGSECATNLFLVTSSTPGASGAGDATHAAWYVLVDTGNDAGKQVAIPGDPVYIARVKALVAAFGARYDSNPTVSYVAITGPGNHDEWNIGGGDVDTAFLGNTQAKVDAWLNETKQFIDAFIYAFPTTTVIGVIDKPFANTMGTNAFHDANNYGASYGSRYGMAFNGLNANSSTSNDVANQIFLHWTTNPTWSQFGAAGGGTQGVPLSEGVDQGLRSAVSLKIRGSEIYKPDTDDNSIYSYTAPSGSTWQGNDVSGTAAGITVRRAEMLNLALPPCPSPTPAPPSNLTATTASATQINLTWSDNSNNEQGFLIERSANDALHFLQIASVGANIQNYPDTGRTACSSYYYRVRAYNGGGNSLFSNQASATTVCASPTPTVTPTATVTPTFTPTPTASATFTPTPTATIPPPTPTATPSATPSATATATSTPTSTATFTPTPSATFTPTPTATATAIATPETPTNLVANAVSSTEIDLTWNDVSDDETGFHLRRSLNPNMGGYIVFNVAADATSYNDTSCNQSTRYYYRIHAYNDGGEGLASNRASATTQGPTPTPTVTATATYTPTPTATAAFTPTATPSASPSATATATATSTPTPTPTPIGVIPDVPQNLIASIIGANVTLSWDSANNAVGYHVYEVLIGGITQLDATVLEPTTMVTLFDLPEGDHTFCVTAFNDVGESVCSDSVTVYVAAEVPTAPAGINVTSPPLTLHWTANPVAQAVTEYKVYRIKGGTRTHVGTTVPPTVAFEITPGMLTSNRTGFYVTAVNAIGESANSSTTTIQKH